MLVNTAELAKKRIFEYIEDNKYSIQLINDICLRKFARIIGKKKVIGYYAVIPKKIEPNGLCNDLATVPYVLFQVYEDGTVEEGPDLEIFI